MNLELEARVLRAWSMGCRYQWHSLLSPAFPKPGALRLPLLQNFLIPQGGKAVVKL